MVGAFTKGSSFLRGLLSAPRRPRQSWWCPALLLLAGLLLGGCWDYQDIENRALVVALGLDETSPPGVPGNEGELLLESRRSFRVTSQIVLPPQAGGRQGQGGGGGGEVDPFWNLATVAANGSVFQALREVFTRINLDPSFDHLRVVVLGEELARKGVNEPLEALLRMPEVGRQVLVYIASGEALKVMNIKPKLEPINGHYLANLSQHQGDTGHAGPQRSLGDLSRAIHEGQPLVLPRVVPDSDEAKLAGMGVFDPRGKLLGWLGEAETQYQRLIMGNFNQGVVVVTRRGEAVALELSNAKTRVVPQLNQGQVSFTIRVEAEGQVQEAQETGSLFLPQNITGLEEEFARELERGMEATVHKVQEEFGVDIFGLGTALGYAYPIYWEGTRTAWQRDFRDVPVRAEARVMIRRVGVQLHGK